MSRHWLATRSRWHLAALLGIAGFFLMGGAGHFLLAPFFVAIVPGYLPAPEWLVAISGACELLGACGLLWPVTRWAAGIGLLALTVAVLPANLQMALHPERYAAFAPWLLMLRLPLQMVILAWIGFAMRRAGMPTR